MSVLDTDTSASHGSTSSVLRFTRNSGAAVSNAIACCSSTSAGSEPVNEPPRGSAKSMCGEGALLFSTTGFGDVDHQIANIAKPTTAAAAIADHTRGEGAGRLTDLANFRQTGQSAGHPCLHAESRHAGTRLTS